MPPRLFILPRHDSVTDQAFHMAKSRPTGSSKTERKGDLAETSAPKSAPSPTTDSEEGKDSENPTAAPSKTAADSGPRPIESDPSARPASAQSPSDSKPESVADPKFSRVRSPAVSVPGPISRASAEELKPGFIAEGEPAKSPTEIKQAGDSTAETKPAPEIKPATGTIAAAPKSVGGPATPAPARSSQLGQVPSVPAKPSSDLATPPRVPPSCCRTHPCSW